MAGFLRQLAEQALQPTTGLHSAAASAYAGSTRIDAGGPTWEPELAVPAAKDASPGRKVPRANRDQPRSVEESGKPPTVPALIEAGENGRAAEPATGPDLAATRVAAPPASRRKARSGRTVAPVDREPEYSLPASRRHVGPDTAAGPGHAQPEQPLHAHNSRSSGSTLALKPAVTRSRVETPARTSAFVARGEAAQSGPEVHIHIGRIELTAATPAPVVRREAGAGRKPLSLDAYLKQRGSKSP